MDIKKVIVTKTAISETENAKYHIEYSVEDSKLLRVGVSIYKRSEDNEEYVGHISVENEMLSSSIQRYEKAFLYFKDFEELLSMITKDMELE